jgi:hypothetical protein
MYINLGWVLLLCAFFAPASCTAHDRSVAQAVVNYLDRH